MPTNSDAVILSAEDFATLKERSEFADELFELTTELKDEVETLKAGKVLREKVIEERTTEIDNLKEEIAGLVVEEERVGEEASVLADNCERLLCAIHGKKYSETDYAFGAEECSEVSVIEEAIDEIVAKRGAARWFRDKCEELEEEVAELKRQAEEGEGEKLARVSKEKDKWEGRHAILDQIASENSKVHRQTEDKLAEAEQEIERLEQEIDWRVREAKEDKEEWNAKHAEEWLEEFSDEPLSQTKKAVLPYLEDINNFNPAEFWYCRERWGYSPSWSLKDPTEKRYLKKFADGTTYGDKRKVIGRNTLPNCAQKNEAHKRKMVEEGVSEEGDLVWEARAQAGVMEPRDNYCFMFYNCFKKGYHEDFVRGQKGVFLESMKFYHRVNCDKRYRHYNRGMRKGTKVKMALVNKEL
tara:strand:- start:24 stop:1262 length:1239 start_codon:yes stop_codon:yes gene_type:complete